jgi:hypothetical protein
MKPFLLGALAHCNIYNGEQIPRCSCKFSITPGNCAPLEGHAAVCSDTSSSDVLGHFLQGLA